MNGLVALILAAQGIAFGGAVYWYTHRKPTSPATDECKHIWAPWEPCAPEIGPWHRTYQQRECLSCNKKEIEQVTR